VRLGDDAVARLALYGEAVEPVTTPLHRLTRWFRGVNPWVIDAVLGTVFTVLGLLGLVAGDDRHNAYKDPDALAVVLSLACTMPLYLRRRAPLATHVATLSAVVALATLEYPNNPQTQVVMLTSYAVAAYTDGVKRAAGFAAIVAAVAAVAILGIPEADGVSILFAGAFFVAAYFVGSTVRNRHLYLQQLEERAALLERERDEEAKRAVADERLRIAQELHDVVAHSMGVIAVQAGVGAHVIDADPAEAKRSLEAISHTSRSTLAEIRRLLGVLREDEGAAYAPAPGLAELGRLVRDVQAAGLDVDVERRGAGTELPPGVDLTAYRIVQEALTNVLKHAGPSRASVVIGYEPGALSLEIVDDGRGVNGRSGPGGHGLLGMRERVAVYGGSFEAGPRAGGGFRVAVRLPFGDAG
jgi:signal transduction histidine kinase